MAADTRRDDERARLLLHKLDPPDLGPAVFYNNAESALGMLAAQVRNVRYAISRTFGK